MQSRHAGHTRGLTKDTRLRLAEALHIEARGPLIRLDTDGAALEPPRSIFPVLAFFEEVRSVEEG